MSGVLRGLGIPSNGSDTFLIGVGAADITDLLPSFEIVASPAEP